jgi:hypothetical protein
LQILTRPVGGLTGTVLLVKVTIVWVARSPPTMLTIAVRAPTSLSTRRLDGLALMPTSCEPVRATSVRVALPTSSWSGRLQPPTGTVTVWVGLPVWLTVTLKFPLRLSPSTLALQTSSHPLGVALLVKVRIVWLDTPPATIATLAVRAAVLDWTSRPDGAAAIAATLKPGRATSVTLAAPVGSVIGRLQPPTGTSMVP